MRSLSLKELHRNGVPLQERGWRTSVPHPRNSHEIHGRSGRTQPEPSQDLQARDGGGQRSTTGTLGEKVVRDRRQATEREEEKYREDPQERRASWVKWRGEGSGESRRAEAEKLFSVEGGPRQTSERSGGRGGRGALLGNGLDQIRSYARVNIPRPPL